MEIVHILRLKQEVFRLQISMDYLLGVEMGYGCHYLLEYSMNLVFRKEVLVENKIKQFSPRTVIADYVEVLVVLIKLIYLEDIIVIQVS